MTTTTKTTNDLEQFYTELLNDSMLQERLKTATDPESLSELAVELGKEKGYFFTEEEVLAAMAIEAAMGGEYEQVFLTTWNYTEQPLMSRPGPACGCPAGCCIRSVYG